MEMETRLADAYVSFTHRMVNRALFSIYNRGSFLDLGCLAAVLCI
jgi:hypothetical protein